MGRSLTDIIADLPADEQAAIEQRYQELKQDVEGLRELRQIAGKAQADIASALNIKQPSVSQIERQTDMYLSTLRNYVEAIGGQLELTVKLPARRTLKLQSIGDFTAPEALPRSTARRRKPAAGR